jgi:cytochrome c55X
MIGAPQGEAVEASQVGRTTQRSVTAAIVVAASMAAFAGTSQAGDAPTPERQRELATLVRQDCGSCHGMRLTGGLGPALTPQALAGKPGESLAATIVHGRAGTPMPPWRRFVSDAEAAWLVAALQEGTLDAPPR